MLGKLGISIKVIQQDIQIKSQIRWISVDLKDKDENQLLKKWNIKLEEI